MIRLRANPRPISIGFKVSPRGEQLHYTFGIADTDENLLCLQLLVSKFLLQKDHTCAWVFLISLVKGESPLKREEQFDP
jgi:hypothetical protein